MTYLYSLVRDTRKHMSTMCDTGEGLTKQELEELEIPDPELYNKWGEQCSVLRCCIK